MQAATYTTYGGPEVVTLRDIPRPAPKRSEILVRVGAAGVTTADWRLRAAAFPGPLMQVAGRLMFGLRRPRKPVLGGDFAGTVEAVGAGVTAFAPGDRVFGFSGHGAHAEYLVMPEKGAIAPIPPGLTELQAAALPFGGLAALAFLADFGRLKAGERVLVVGGSGGVGVYAVQIARALGAEVTAVASAGRAELLKSLGAEQVIDYRTGPIAAQARGRFDVILDTVGALDYAAAAPLLATGGRFVPLNFGLRDMLAKRRARRAGHEIVIAVSGDTRDGLERLSALVAKGQLRPVIDRALPFARIREAHAHVEGRHRAGSVVLGIRPEALSADAA